MEKYYTVDQVAELIEMHPKTIRKFIREGKLKANKVGKQWRITGHDLSLFTEGSSKVKISNDDISLEFTTDSEKNNHKVKVSSVIDIEVEDSDEASRISNMLMAVMNNKDPKYGKSTINIQYIPKEFKVRVMIWGSLDFTEVMLNSIGMLTNKG